ncbi:uracil-DNA glycosylase family protein [Vulgatibacter incomptus]|nr:uracil-DNA glycosylase family protein [Vulgatibacter incomptus]
MSARSSTDRLIDALRPLRFGPPVTHVYDPLEYARAAFDEYVDRYGRGTREILLLGMNPGPFGMAQTGVPFGEVHHVRTWLGIEGEVGRPSEENPNRPIQGFACHRSEVSGARVWGWAKETFGTPERFFARFFVINYCPLVFMEASGRNVTPDKLPRAEREPLFAVCDEALRETVERMRPRWVIGIGGFAEDRAREALAGLEVKVGRILHPSPASPKANQGWAGIVTRELAELGIELP